MARGHEIVGLRVGPNGRADGVGAIGGADARRDAGARLDAHGERGAERRSAAPRQLHHRQLEAIDELFVEGEADEPSPVHRHEVDGFGRDLFGRHREVPFVLAVLVVDEDDHRSGAHFIERLVHARQ